MLAGKDWKDFQSCWIVVVGGRQAFGKVDGGGGGDLGENGWEDNLQSSPFLIPFTLSQSLVWHIL
jgi:hypothetical protein